MYFKLSVRTNPSTGQLDGYYRLVESYRNFDNRVCHRTLLNIGFLEISPEKLNMVRQLLNDRLEGKASLFDQQDQEVLLLTDHFWNLLVSNKKVDVSPEARKRSSRMVDMDTIKHRDARELGAEWMCYQALEQLRIGSFLEGKGWQKEQIKLAITQIISRAVYPYSEYRSCRWIKENSALCEITDYPMEAITKDKLYKSALKLFSIKDALETHLSTRTNELFDLQDHIILYDLTNTYFEGSKSKSKLAKYGKSKEKRNDAKLLVLALVLNPQGFIKFSSVFEGSMCDSNSMPAIIDKVRQMTSSSQRAVVVMDAGIATEENLSLLEQKGYNYVCVHRGKVKDYIIDPHFKPEKVLTAGNQSVHLVPIISPKTKDYLFKVHSTAKHQTEASMLDQFEQRFLEALKMVQAGIERKGGVKAVQSVERRIGRVFERYPSVAKHYHIEVKSEDGRTAAGLIIQRKMSYFDQRQAMGEYFIRTNFQVQSMDEVWSIYNTIREIESSFRCLKNDLDLRPIYHQNDESSVAHMHLGILAYWVVNTIRFQLKTKGINHNWQEIIRITNTQKLVSTTGQNTFDQTIFVRRCTEPNDKVKEIYHALGFKNYPFVKRKSVVHKSELENNKYPYSSKSDDS